MGDQEREKKTHTSRHTDNKKFTFCALYCNFAIVVTIISVAKKIKNQM